MKIVFLDKKTLGDDIDFSMFDKLGDVVYYETTTYNEIIKRLEDVDVVVTNKVIIDKNIIDNTNLKLICVAATGMNNIDLDYAKQKNIVVKNVAGYSTNSVVQTTFMMVLTLLMHTNYYDNFCKIKRVSKLIYFYKYLYAIL